MDVYSLVEGHEGFRGIPYLDIVGNTSIGYGHNLTADGLTRFEARVILQRDIGEITKALNKLSWYTRLTTIRQSVIIDVAFNVGLHGLFEFKDMITALRAEDWTTAASQLLASRAADELPQRYKEDARILLSNSYG